jgi:hypothetical protein
MWLSVSARKSNEAEAQEQKEGKNQRKTECESRAGVRPKRSPRLPTVLTRLLLLPQAQPQSHTNSWLRGLQEVRSGMLMTRFSGFFSCKAFCPEMIEDTDGIEDQGQVSAFNKTL